MKKCTICAEEIQDEAKKCRFCGGALDTGEIPGRLRAPCGPQETSGMAIASLVLGICWFYWIGSILALVFGYMAQKEIAQEPARLSGRGMAKAGIVLGWVGIGTLVVTVIVLLLVFLFKKPAFPWPRKQVVRTYAILTTFPASLE